MPVVRVRAPASESGPSTGRRPGLQEPRETRSPRQGTRQAMGGGVTDGNVAGTDDGDERSLTRMGDRRAGPLLMGRGVH